MRADKLYSAGVFGRKLHNLKVRHKNRVKKWRNDRLPRASLKKAERKEVLRKTGGRCHLCGGKIIGDEWQADHVVPYASKGTQSLKNYLPAHSLCNSYRRCRSPVEFQLILKLGAWIRSEMAKQSDLGKKAAERFCQKEQSRDRRRKA